MGINERKPEEVLKPEFIQRYKELHLDIWYRLTRTNATITILEEIQNFPFQRIYAPIENIFWITVSWNFLHIAIVFLHALVEDQGKDAHTLNVFKNKVAKWLKDGEREVYFKKLEDAKFSKSTKTILKKITDMRHQLLAHRLLDGKDYLLNPDGIVVSEIRSAYNDVEKLFHMCSFGAEYICNFYINGTVGGKPIEKDIDHLLNLIVKDSYWLNEPERDPTGWQYVKDAKAKGEIAELNKWREKLGLPTV